MAFSVETYALAKKLVNDLQKQLDDMVIEDGEGNAEVIQARGDYDLLYKRLDEADKRINGKVSGIDLNEHVENKDNPHEVNKSDVGLENVNNTEQADKVDFDNHVGETSKKHIYGSDSGKSYIRFDDGTQICFLNVTLKPVTGRTMNINGKDDRAEFTKSFNNIPIIVGSVYPKTDSRKEYRLEDLAEMYFFSIDESSFKLGIKVNPAGGNAFKDGDELSINVVAYGSWK